MRFLDPKFRLAEAAFAAGIPQKTLRNWIERSQISLFSSRADGKGWRTFCLADIAHMALIRHLVEHGFKVLDADAVSRQLLTGEASALTEEGVSTSLIGWTNEAAIVRKHGGQGIVTRWPEKDPFPASEMCDAALVLFIGKILSEAVGRAIQLIKSPLSSLRTAKVAIQLKDDFSEGGK